MMMKDREPRALTGVSSASEEGASLSPPKFRGLRRQRKSNRIRERRGAVSSSKSALRTKRPCPLLDDAMTAVNEIMHEERSRLKSHEIISDDSDDEDNGDEQEHPIGFIGTKRHRRNSCLSSFSETHNTPSDSSSRQDSIASSVVSSLTLLQIQNSCQDDQQPNSSARRVSDDDLQAAQQKAAHSSRRKGWIQKLC